MDKAFEMDQIRKDIKLKQKCLTKTIADLKKMLNKKERRTFYQHYMYHSQFTEIAQIKEAADLISGYQNDIAVLRKYA